MAHHASAQYAAGRDVLFVFGRNKDLTRWDWTNFLTVFEPPFSVGGTVKSYAQNSLQAAERSVVMQWRDR